MVGAGVLDVVVARGVGVVGPRSVDLLDNVDVDAGRAALACGPGGRPEAASADQEKVDVQTQQEKEQNCHHSASHHAHHQPIGLGWISGT